MAMILLNYLPEGAISRLQLHNAGRRKAFQGTLLLHLICSVKGQLHQQFHL
jgi:hypothetical protein